MFTILDKIVRNTLHDISYNAHPAELDNAIIKIICNYFTGISIILLEFEDIFRWISGRLALISWYIAETFFIQDFLNAKPQMEHQHPIGIPTFRQWWARNAQNLFVNWFVRNINPWLCWSMKAIVTMWHLYIFCKGSKKEVPVNWMRWTKIINFVHNRYMPHVFTRWGDILGWTTMWPNYHCKY